MYLHPAIAALRSDPISQRRTKAAMADTLADWHNGRDIAAIAEELSRYAAGDCLSQLSALRALVSDLGEAQRFLNAFTEHFMDALEREPLGEIPFRHGGNDGFFRMQILQRGGGVLSLMVYEPIERSQEPQAALFADCTTHEIVVAGSARGVCHDIIETRPGSAAITSKAVRWSTGDIIAQTAQRQSRQIVEVSQSLVVLQLSRAPVQPLPTREYRLCDGALIHSVSGDKRASEKIMALCVLGAMGEARALPVLSDTALNRSHDPDLRWEAVRQSIALDAAAGMALLKVLEERGNDPLSGPAGELRDQLCRAHPGLQNLTGKAA